MSIQLALDSSTNDLIKRPGGGYERVDKGRYTVQTVKCKLNTVLGEWALDPSLGWLNFSDFRKQYDLFDIEVRATKIILGTEGVLTVDSIHLVMKGRTLTLTFTATTIYGKIDLTIPWSS